MEDVSIDKEQTKPSKEEEIQKGQDTEEEPRKEPSATFEVASEETSENKDNQQGDDKKSMKIY